MPATLIIYPEGSGLKNFNKAGFTVEQKDTVNIF